MKAVRKNTATRKANLEAAMAKRTSRDKFRVGQRVVFVFEGDCDGWESINGEEGIVDLPKHVESGMCHSFDWRPVGIATGEYYGVRYRGGEILVFEEDLRPLYDGDALSTWAKFAKATGIDLRAAIIDAVPVKPRKPKRAKHEA
jgi:hypothetical protein